MIKHSDLIYDVGMHKGEDTDYYLKKGFKVVGFEANPSLIQLCKQRFSKELRSKRLIIIEGAIVDFESEKQNTVRFYKNLDDSVWGTVVNDWAERNERLGTSNEIIEVPTVSFTDCLKQYGIPYYLKIDIEGMDTICLKSLLKFNEKPDYLSIESEKISFNKLENEFSLLAKLGYKRFQVINQANITSLKEPKNSKEGQYLDYEFAFGSSGLFGKDLPHSWKNHEEIIRQYRWIFLGYKLFGDSSKIRKYFLGQKLNRLLDKLLQQPIPGWFDTHAKHSSVNTGQ
ncbi:FkbM family methyltransferase [Pseudomonadota bacterium]